MHPLFIERLKITQPTVLVLQMNDFLFTFTGCPTWYPIDSATAQTDGLPSKNHSPNILIL